MINIHDEKDCCGCGACVQCCPQKCISMNENHEGFLYPKVDVSKCIDCHLCEKVCPFINNVESNVPLKVYAAKNKNEYVRKKSSSGGIFTSLAEFVITDKKGVVFGAAFDDKWNVYHTYIDSTEKLNLLRGSKYVQSRIGNAYIQVKDFLSKGITVLFTGTPCQISGLKRYLRKDYDNLYTVEILCHGVPSPKVWSIYLSEKRKQYGHNINGIEFRNKEESWQDFRFIIKFINNDASCVSDKDFSYGKKFSEDSYMKGFLANLYLRPSCYTCKCKNGRSGSDITIADYWNIDAILPEFNDNKGVSLVLINSKKGEYLYSNINGIEFEETKYEISKGKNGGFAENIPVHPHRKSFFKKYKSVSSISFYIEKKLQPSLIQRIKNRLRHVI